MYNKLKYLLLTSFLIFMGLFGFSQNSTKENNRPAYAAGRFYEQNPIYLRQNLEDLFKKVNNDYLKEIRALIAPHAGYVFSGEVAAHAYSLLDPKHHYQNVFIIASSHRTYFSYASIYYKGNYETPLGEVIVNRELAGKLIDKNNCFKFYPDAHIGEHSLEVQLPFLQYVYGSQLQIVPIIMGTSSMKEIEEIAKALKPYFTSENLFVISTDFSHYPAYDDAIKVDMNTASAIEKKSVKELKNALKKNKEEGFINLSTSLCGWSSVYALLYLLEDETGLNISPLKYMNSGDQAFGSKDRVVGYYSFVVKDDKIKDKGVQQSFLTNEDKHKLLKISRQTLTDYIGSDDIPNVDTKEFSGNLFESFGAFVTLNIDGKLRGCIGRFNSSESLYKLIQQMTISSSTSDYRFPRVSSSEVDKIEIEISVLSPMKKISSIDEIELGKHGIYMKKGEASGTFLPKVAVSTEWTLEEFLGHCAKDKAGIGWNGWKDAEIFVYEALDFSESDFK